mmetsp:Transcript_21563/g.51466  ORF Transcript_21563/g.51466 Transcript_21563/m.51466 type:complete len:241 (-) Transcript_21563:792-1514(-)
MSATDFLGEEASHRGSIIVKDSLTAPGAFLVPLMLKYSVKLGEKVLFIAADQSRVHYSQVLRRQGVSLEEHIANSEIEFLDMLTEFRVLTEKTSKGSSLPWLLHEWAAPIIKASSEVPGASIAFFVDDLTTLSTVSSCEGASHTGRLLQSVRGLCAALGLPFRFVALVHSDVADPGAAAWIDAADVEVEVDSLGTASDDVHGQVSVHHRRIWSEMQEATCHSMYYRFVEGGVRFWSDVAL